MDEPCAWGRTLEPEHPAVPIVPCEEEPTVMLWLEDEQMALYVCPLHQLALSYAGAI